MSPLPAPGTVIVSSSSVTAAVGRNMTMPDLRLVAFYNEMRSHGTADPPQLRRCPAACRIGMPPQTIW